MTMVAALVVTALLLASLGAVVVGQRRAQAAADLAALAGAVAAQRGRDPCDAATTMGRLNGGRLVSCEVDALTVRVTLERVAATAVGPPVTLSAEARAGPESAGGPEVAEPPATP